MYNGFNSSASGMLDSGVFFNKKKTRSRLKILKENFIFIIFLLPFTFFARVLLVMMLLVSSPDMIILPVNSAISVCFQ